MISQSHTNCMALFFYQQKITYYIMNLSEKYHEDEWKIISYLPQAIGLAMGGAGSKQMLASGTEMIACTKAVSHGEEEFANNELIHEIIGTSKDLKIVVAGFKKKFDVLTAVMQTNNIKSTNDLFNYLLKDCGTAITLLQQKETPKTIDEYKKWILSIALKVAHNSKEGSFLGFGGERFSKEERRLYKKLELILN